MSASQVANTDSPVETQQLQEFDQQQQQYEQQEQQEVVKAQDEQSTEQVDDLTTQSEEVATPRWKRYALAAYRYCLSQWFFFVLAILIIIARWWPNFARDEGIISAQYSIGYLAVALIFFKSGCTIPTTQMLKNIYNWRAHLVVQLFSFLITSSISYAFCLAILRSSSHTINEWVLVGIIVTMSCPTTVASNVVMTRQAGGNVTLTVCEVIIGNIMGAFITPAVTQMYLQGDFKFGNPANGSSVSEVYRRVMQQIGCSLFVPFFIGQLLRIKFVKQIDWTIKTFHLQKLGSWCLLAIMFNSFSTAFHQHAFTEVSHVTVVFICFFNVGLYLFFTVLSFLAVRPFFIPLMFKEEDNGRVATFFKKFYFSRKDATAILFCTSAKTASLGVSLITSQYGTNIPQLGSLLVPLVLYQSEQVLTASFMVPGFKKWIENEERQNAIDEENQQQNQNKDLAAEENQLEIQLENQLEEQEQNDSVHKGLSSESTSQSTETNFVDASNSKQNQ